MGKKFPAVNGLLLLFVLFFIVSCSDMMDSYSAQGEEEFTRTTADVWIQATAPCFSTHDVECVAFGDGIFVAGTNHGEIGYSSDGDTWTLSSSSPVGSMVTCICYGKNKYMMTAGTFMYESSDGDTWASVDVSSFGGSGIYTVRYVNGIFLAATVDGKIGYSSDGNTWTLSSTTNLGSTISCYDFCYGDNKYIAVGEGGNIIYSTDYDMWTQATTDPFGTNAVAGVCYVNGKYVAVGMSGIIATSTDGDTWTEVSDSTFGSSTIFSIESQGILIAVGDGGKIAYSVDGDNWTQVPTSSFDTTRVRDVTYGNGLFVSVGDDGKIAYSIE